MKMIVFFSIFNAVYDVKPPTVLNSWYGAVCFEDSNEDSNKNRK